MNRIFAYLAWFAMAFLAATLVLGLSLGDVRDPDDLTTQRWATVHRLSGVAVALCIVLVDSIVVTYFIGTSRWCREVSDTYRLDASLVREANAIKRRTFPYAVASMLAVVGIVALGGAADPGASLQLQPIGGMTWANVHLIGALAGLAFIAYAFFIQWVNIEQQRDVIARILEEVKQIRLARGLEVEEHASPF